MTIMSDIHRALRKAEYRLTPQREKIVSVLLENRGKHLSADDVYNLVKEKAPEIGLSTVYRTLELFVDCKLVNSINFGDKRKRYELSPEIDSHHHHHLICLKCGSIVEVTGDELDDLEKRIAKEHNFSIVDHQLKFFGYCQKCRQDDDN